MTVDAPDACIRTVGGNMTKALLGTAVGALTLGSLVTAQALKAPSTEASPNAATSASRSDASTSPVLVNCGDGYKALIRPVAVAGQQVSQVDCVSAAPAYPVSLDAYGQPVPYSAAQPVLATYTDAPARPSVQTRTVYREQPAPVYRTATRTTTVRQPTTQTRSWKKSALIIGGSAAGGAAVGAVIDGGSGAKKGAIIGGVGGLVYDLATRNK
jgi:hypothetical protein